MDRNSKKIVRLLLDDGFRLVSVKGSHHKFARTEGESVRTVIVPHPKKDLPTGTARAIAQQAGWIK
jgi:predicted RNA binding protein YcfA (HicA-like mRNA interferase family)